MASDAVAEDVSDERLVADGDIQSLYNRYARRMLGFLANQGIAPRDREDVHHEVWLRVCRQLPEFRNEHFRGWIFAIARNLAADWKAKRRPVALEPAFDDVDSRTVPSLVRMEEEEHRERFERCLKSLPEAEETLIRGRIDGEEYEMLAERLGWTIKQAYRTFFEVKARLQKCTERAGS
jgi:RNA polymerase sigma factor (sigma-70 family)